MILRRIVFLLGLMTASCAREATQISVAGNSWRTTALRPEADVKLISSLMAANDPKRTCAAPSGSLLLAQS